MTVDASTTLGGITEPGWGPTRYEAYQLRDYLDLRAYYADGTTRPLLRLWSNQDAHLYGELILHNGAVRSFNTMSMQCVTPGQDIVSFRAGTSTGSQVARIGVDGSYNIYGAGQQASFGASVLRYFGAATIRVQSATGSYQALTMEGSTLTLNALDGSTIRAWATLSMDGTGTRMLSYPNLSLLGGHPLQLDVGTLRLRAWQVSSSSHLTWGEFDVGTGGVRRLVMADDTRFEVYDGTNWQDFTLEACNITFQTKCTGGTVTILDANGNVTGLYSPSGGWVRVSSPASTSASLELDATRTTGAKKWEIRSDQGNGELKLVNQTDTGTPTVRVTPSGSVYSPEFVGTKTVTAAPADTAGEGGALVVDTTNKRLWVKVADSGTNRWWYASLTSP